MHSDNAYLRRIFKMPPADTALQNDLQVAAQQLLDTLPLDKHALVFTLLDKQTHLQTDCCVRSFIQGYELAVGIEWRSK